jgi:ParB family chromosome partitioning protein
MPEARQLSIAEALAERVAEVNEARAAGGDVGDALGDSGGAPDDRVLASILPGQHLASIRLELIAPAPQGQVRQVFDEERLLALAESLKRSGVREPIIVSPHGAPPGRFMIVAGERRWRAAQLAGLSEIPCIVDPSLVGDREKLLAQAEENLHRENLNPVEEAGVLAQLMQSRGLDVRAAGELMGRSYIQARRLQRLHLAITPIKEAVARGDLDGRAAVEVIRIYNTLARSDSSEGLVSSAERIERLIERIAREKWSTRRIEQYATKLGASGDDETETGAAPEDERTAAAHGEELTGTAPEATYASLGSPGVPEQRLPDRTPPLPLLTRADGRIVIEEARIGRGLLSPEDRAELIAVLEDLLMRVRRS